jgi:glycosyltransferase involved in cell wall biosynthesis
MDSSTVYLSIVVPMYNEETVIDIFFERIIPILEDITPDYEIICVDDGSDDETFSLLGKVHDKNPEIKILNLSRNFGKELAMTAGIDHAAGQAVIPLDADLQDPPELIAELVEKWREGYDMVLAKRVDRSSDSAAKRFTARLFYRLIDRISEVPIPENVGDFRLMDRRVVDALAMMPERTRFMKGMFAWLGFKQATVPYTRAPRAAGTTKWHFMPLWNFALQGIVSFTNFPLKIWSYIGIVCALGSMTYGTFIVLRTLIYGVDVPGYASLIAIILFFNGLIMMSLGIMGEYMARLFVEVKRRPLYLVRDAVGFGDALATNPRVGRRAEKD